MGALFFRSTDDGRSFAEIGTIDDPVADTGLCCGTLFELPSKRLLWAASVGGDVQTSPMSLVVWASDDGGANWTTLSRIATATKNRSAGGLWEPEFSLAANDADDAAEDVLVVHWSDETDSAHSQKLVAARSTDGGLHWQDTHDTVALDERALRPGMANVRRDANGNYVMTYEICGLDGDSCSVWLRTSFDGWSWGDPTDQGIQPMTADGIHFRHAPTLAFANGHYVLVGQMAYDADGNVAPENGTIVMTTNVVTSLWSTQAAPVAVPDAFDNFCPNYSSPLLPLDGGSVMLELASRWDGTSCRTYYAAR